MKKKIPYILFCIFLGDCCFFGAGRLIEYRFLGFRMMLAIAVVVASLPALWKYRKKLIRNPFLIGIGAFGGWLVFSTALGIQNQNPTNLILSDLKGFLYFMLFPCILCLFQYSVNGRERLEQIMKIIAVCGGILAVISDAFLLCYLYCKPLYIICSDFLLARQISVLTVISDAIPRIFMKSSMHIVGSCIFTIYFALKEGVNFWSKKNTLCVINIALCVFSIMLTYTRSAFLGIGGSAIVLLIYYGLILRKKQVRFRFWSIAISSCAIFFAFLFVFDILGNTGYLRYAIDRTAVSFRTEKITEPLDIGNKRYQGEGGQQKYYDDITLLSDQIRKETIADLADSVKSSPVVGNGLGTPVLVRVDGKSEYFYWELLSKTGIIGLFLYFLPLIIALFYFVKKKYTVDCDIIVCWGAFLFGILLFSFFNPYMNSALGLPIYCIFLSFFCPSSQKEKTKR